MKEMKPVGGLAHKTIVMLFIYIFSMACHMMTSIYEVIELSLHDPDAYLDGLLLSQTLTARVGLGFLVIYIITAIFFLKWTYRISKNLHTLSGGTWQHSAGSAVGWHFVPIACLFKPYQAMREIWTKAHKAWTPNTKLLPGWWTLWLISTFLGQILWRQEGEVIRDFQLIAITQIISDIIDIALGLTAIALVSNIARAYEENFCGAAGAEEDMLEMLSETTDDTSSYQKNLQSQTKAE